MINKIPSNSKKGTSILVFITAFILGAIAYLFIEPPKAEAQTLSPSICQSMISDHVSWAQRPGRVVDSQIASIAIKTLDPQARLDFGFGRWGYARLNASGGNLHGSYQEYFSDRRTGRHNRQPFDQAANDWTTVTISPNTGVTLRLLSWGNARVRLTNVSCTSDGFIVARWPGNWGQIVTIALVKTYE